MAWFEKLFDNASPEEISRCEERLGVSLPSCYKAFLAATNGGTPHRNLIGVPDCGETLVNVLYGVGDDEEQLGLVHEQQWARDFGLLPEGWIRIGNDPGGNSFLLCTVDERRGQIYYWDSANFFDTSSAEDGNIYFVANSIEEFVKALRPMPEA